MSHNDRSPTREPWSRAITERVRHIRTVLSLLAILAVTLATPLSSAAMQDAAADAARGRTADRVALVRVPVQSPATARAAVTAGLLPYRLVSGTAGDYLIAGLVLPPGGSVPDVGMPVQVLDPDTRGASYYLATGRAAWPAPDWAAFGTVLFDDGPTVVLRMSPDAADRLAAAGAELAAVPLVPMPVPAAEPATGGAAAPLAVTPNPTVQTMIDQVSTSALTTYEQELTGVVATTIEGATYTIRSRNTNSGTPIQKATRYAGEHFAARGLTVEYHTWNVSTNPNVIGELPGQTNPSDIVIIGAHLDDMPGGSVAPGADDNGSGSTAVLIAADILTQYQWSCTLRFALWTGEEQGLLGSAAYARRAFTRGEAIRGYLNLDMIAYDSSGFGEIDLVSRSSVPGSVAMMNLFADVIDAYGLDLEAVKLVDDSLGNYSDNASFWTYGFAALFGIEGDTYGFNPYYHSTSDTFSTVNLPFMKELTKGALGTFVHLSDCLLTTTPGPSATPTATATRTPTRTPTPVPSTPTTGVGGTLRYYVGDRPIPTASLELAGAGTMTTATDAAGTYVFANPPFGTSALTPSKHGDTGSAVSSLDAAYVLQSVVGSRTLDARQQLACEVSGNGTISALDASLILQKVVGMIGTFPVARTCGSEWIFVPTPAVVPNQRLVQPATTGGTCQAGALAYEPLSAAAAGQDFRGIVLGDCTGNWAAPSGAGSVGAASDPATQVRLGRPQARAGRSTVPVEVDGGGTLHAVDLEVQATGGDGAVRVRRGPAAATAAMAIATAPGGRVRIALASGSVLDTTRGPLLLIDVRGGRAASTPLRIVRAAVDDVPVGP